MRNATVLVLLACILPLASHVFAGSVVSWGTVVFDSAELGGNEFVDVAAGGYHSLALRSDGSIVGWGYNSSGQASPPDGNDFIAVVAGIYHSLALKSNGSIVGWGSERSVPAGKDFVAIATCKWHSLALRSDGSIVGWGRNTSGQATPPDGNDFVAIAVGENYSLALQSNGSIVGWGDNYADQATPPDGNDFVAIAAGYNHSLALKSDGSIVGWGRDDFGQATPPDGNDFVAVAAQYFHSVALKSDGSIVRWGANYYGQAIPPAGNDFIAIAAGAEHGLALKSDGSIVGWGMDHLAQARPPKGTDFVTVVTGGYTVCSSMMGCEHLEYSLALKSDGSIVGWGRNDHGQATPPDGNDFIAIAAGTEHGLALKSDGSIVGWGNNGNYTGDWLGQATPPEGNDFVAIAAGDAHSLALKSDGSIVGWGLNDDGQATPPDGNAFVAIVAGGNHSLALKSDGSLLGWGSNDVWVLGWSDKLEKYYCGQATPPGGDDYLAIASAGGQPIPGRQQGGGHSLALKSDGSIVGWGCGGLGHPPEGNDFVAIAAGPERGLALKSDGSIVAWGEEHTTVQATPPEGKDFVAIAVGGHFSLAIRNTSGKYGGGTGEPNDPYLIYTAEHLNALGAEPNDYDKHFKLMADIDLSGYVYDRAVIAPDTYDADLSFQGTPFTGAFDGNEHVISNLAVTGTTYLGLFGRLVDAEVKNLGVTDVDVVGSEQYAGGLAGEQKGGDITACFSRGSVTGGITVGGLVGSNEDGSVHMSYSACEVSGTVWFGAGGLVGSNDGSITSCYSTNLVRGIWDVGGLAGSNIGDIVASYSTATVTGEVNVGGFVGSGGFSVVFPGEPTGTWSDPPIWSRYGTTSASFWDVERSGQPTSAGGTGLTTAEMQTASTFLDAGWDFVGETENGPNDVWKIIEGRTYPLLSWQKYGGGTGEPNDPYLIYTAEHLNALGAEPNDYDKHFKLMADIDLSEYVYDRAVIAPDADPCDPSFIGSSFTGVFDGNSHEIRNLSITGEGYLGLFGRVSGAAIKNLSLVDVRIAGSGSSVGGLAGDVSPHGAVANCLSTGAVTGDQSVGGLAGSNCGSITSCCSTATVNGYEYVGGLVGYIYSEYTGWGNAGGSVCISYSTGTVTADSVVGGLVGCNLGIVTKSYSVAMVTGTNDVGGLIGRNDRDIRYYSTGMVTGSNVVGDLAVRNEMNAYDGTVNSSFWDVETSHQTTSAGGTGLTTYEMQNPETFMAAGWDFVDQPDGPRDIWVEPVGGGYPMLYWQVPPDFGLPAFAGGQGDPSGPYLVSTGEQLNAIGDNPRLMDCHFKLIDDLDLMGLRFYPIGSSDYNYRGLFDGNGHRISHVMVEGQGVFGVLGDGGKIANLGVVDVNVNGGGILGALVGSNRGSIVASYSTGTVKGYDQRIGGLVGWNRSSGRIATSYSTCAVSGGRFAGGLVGSNDGSIAQSYSAGLVNDGKASAEWLGIAGLVGENDGHVADCFWDTETSGQTLCGWWVVDCTGKTTAEMQTASTFLDADWDFVDETENGSDDIWWIDEGQDYPRLWWELPESAEN